jgi:hypothetical protein
MEGYGVITSDDCNFGTVTEVRGDNLIVERGTLRKSHYAVPTTFSSADESERVVRLSVSKEIVEDSPKVNAGELDEQAIAEHYGLAGGFAEPETEGYGEMLADDPARSAEQDQIREGIEPGAQQSARIREEMNRETGGEAAGSSPGLLGDRLGGR